MLVVCGVGFRGLAGVRPVAVLVVRDGLPPGSLGGCGRPVPLAVVLVFRCGSPLVGAPSRPRGVLT